MNKMNRNNNSNNKNRLNRAKVGKKNNVARKQLIGSGAYDFTDIRTAVSKIMKPIIKKGLISTGNNLGGYAGSQFGVGAAGSKLGSMLGAKLSKLIGSGDYKVNSTESNSLIGSKGDSYASFGTTDQSVRIRHREYLQDLVSGPANTFTVENYSVNPGLTYSFPYLSNIAQNFEEYRIHGIVYEFISTTSPYLSTGAMGSVIMAAEYNAASPNFTSKPQMENSDFALSARPDVNLMYGVECASNAQGSYYIRNGVSTLPLTTTDLCNFQIATQTPIASTTLGEVWVTYDIEFLRPKISPARFGYLRSSSTGVLAAAALPAAFLNTTPIALGTMSGVSVSNGTLTFSNAIVGDIYMVTARLTATTSIGGALTASTFSGFGVTVVPFGGGLSGLSTTSTSTSLASYFVQVTAINPTMTFANAGVITGTYYLDVIITDIGNGLGTLL